MGSKRKKRKPLTRVLPELLRVYRYFGDDIRRKTSLITCSFGALIISVLFRLLEPWPLKFLLDQVIDPQQHQQVSSLRLPATWPPLTVITVIAISVVAIATFRAIADYVSKVGFFNVGNSVVIRVRSRTFRHLQNLPMSFHDQAKLGDLINRVTRDVSLLRDVTATAILPLLGSVLVLLGMVTVMFFLDYRLAALGLVVIPLYWVTTVRLGRRIRDSARKQRQRESAMAAIAAETMESIRSIKALGLESRFAEYFDQKNSRSQKDDLKSSRLSLQLGRTVDILLAIATALVMFFGARLVLNSDMLISDLVVFLVYLKRSFKPAQEFAKYSARIAKATAAGERIINILETEPEPKSENPEPAATELAFKTTSIEFRKICFGYDQRQLILKDFSLQVEPGETVAITGPSGAGKSTLMNLLLRLYETQSGQILLGDQDTRRMPSRMLRAKFGLVLQDPLLFAGTIRQNIGIAQPDAEPETIVAAARLAEVDEFVLQMPKLYDTEIGERSAGLSRGQRQRIAIARAAISNRDFLLFDEPTTGLDLHNQRVVADALLELAADKTTLMVTHDLNLARRADRIVFLKDGQVQASGTHECLLKSCPDYATVFESPPSIISN